MGDTAHALQLLEAAAQVFDARDNRLAEAARVAGKRGFDSGGQWMRLALEVLRQESLTPQRINFFRHGLIKYGLACSVALLAVGLAYLKREPWFLLLTIPLFYCVEAQMVFLFPLALDGCSHPIRESRNWTRKAGGTWRVMQTVAIIAVSMIFGGLVGRGFVRSWCVGCLAILIWYEHLRTDGSKTKSGRRLEIGAALPPQTRLAPFHFFGHETPVRLLYASDLHLKGIGSTRAAAQLICAAREHRPDVIVLGGDLADTSIGLGTLVRTVAALTECAPVWAIAGNHDHLIGLSKVIAAVESGGGNWLGEKSVLLHCPGRKPFYLDGAIAAPTVSCHERILCVHDPKIFPQAAARGYPLVLAGHLHGGQCILFNRGGRFYPGSWFYRWNGMRFQLNRSTLLVSRGVSDTLPIRWNCPREILLCELS